MRAKVVAAAIRGDADAEVDALPFLLGTVMALAGTGIGLCFTPLTSIVGYVELLQETAEGITEEERSHFLGVVKRNSERLRRL
mgnify:CR=1 FL=1